MHCPRCGIYQPIMVEELRKKTGGRFDVNHYAQERITTPVNAAWDNACAKDTAQSYTKFQQVWPSLSHLAQEQIRKLKFPRLRKVFSKIYWIMWGLLVVGFVSLIVASFLGNR